MGKVAQGWKLNGILRYDSGRPLLISMNNDLAGLLFNTTKRPNRNSSVDGVATFQGKFDPNRDRYFDRAGWSDPGPLQFGNALSRDGTVRGFRNAVEDVSISKVTQINERYRLRFDVEAGNVSNRVVFCDPTTNFSAGNFVQTGTQCNQPRSVQFSLKFEY